ncbi:unnamed protein product [Calypogeia fissa]
MSTGKKESLLKFLQKFNTVLCKISMEPTDGMKKAWFINALPKKMQFWVKNQKPTGFYNAFLYADSYIDAKAFDEKKKKKKKEKEGEEAKEEEESKNEKKKKKKKKKKTKEDESFASPSDSESEESEEESEFDSEEKAKEKKRAKKREKELTKRLKNEYDTKMDAISSRLHALSLQFT